MRTSKQNDGMSTRALLMFLAALATLALLLVFMLGRSPWVYPPGRAVAPDEPVQAELGEKKQWKKNGYLVQALASFEMTARVIIADRYWSDRESDLSPVDLTVAWGPASDTAILERFDFYKLPRYYRYEWDDPGAPSSVVKAHTANMHMIGRDSYTDSKLTDVENEDIVTIEGYLVEVSATDGWRWKSSLSRQDSGNGACEVVWVDSLKIESP